MSWFQIQVLKLWIINIFSLYFCLMFLNKVKKLKTSVSDMHIKATFSNLPNTPPPNTMAYAVIISDRLFHFVSDGSKITNIV